MYCQYYDPCAGTLSKTLLATAFNTYRNIISAWTIYKVSLSTKKATPCFYPMFWNRLNIHENICRLSICPEVQLPHTADDPSAIVENSCNRTCNAAQIHLARCTPIMKKWLSQPKLLRSSWISVKDVICRSKYSSHKGLSIKADMSWLYGMDHEAYVVSNVSDLDIAHSRMSAH